jgi:hypothetical protein
VMWRPFVVAAAVAGVVPQVHAQQSPAPDVGPAIRIAQSGTPAPGQPAAASDASLLAEKLQNPIADLISFPFQNNTNFNVGPNKGTQDILNIQPVIPVHINQDWNVITRTILPLVWSPSFQPAASVPPFGLAPATFSAFLSPTQTIDGWTWGIGPIVELPTITNKTLGSNIWGLGPAVVAVRTSHPWVAQCRSPPQPIRSKRHRVNRPAVVAPRRLHRTGSWMRSGYRHDPRDRSRYRWRLRPAR